MGAYRYDKLLEHKKAIEDLEGKSGSRKRNLEAAISREQSRDEDRDKDHKIIRSEGFRPESPDGLAEAKDKIVELSLAAKAKDYLVRARQNWMVLSAAGILGLGALFSTMDTQPRNIGEAPNKQTYTVDFDVLRCYDYDNDCGPLQSLPQDDYDILVDISGSMRNDILTSVQEAALEFSSEFAGPQYSFALVTLDDFPTSCYTGPAETRNVGECHGGRYLYTDVGTLRCAGQVVPNVEAGYFDRNGIDEDCNGCADNVYDADGRCLTPVSRRDSVDPGMCEFDYECGQISSGTVCLDGICGHL